MEKEFKKHPVVTEVTIHEYRNPSKSITMNMTQYKNFIKDQAEELGILEPEKKEREVYEVFISVRNLIDPIDHMTGEQLEKAFIKVSEELKRKGK